jgi:membrane protein YdbS with pleckstrin-like domain
MARVDVQRLDPRSVTAGRIGGWIFTAVVALVLGGGALTALLVSHAPAISWLATGILVGVPLTLLALAAHIGPAWRYESSWFRVDEDGLEFVRGRWWRHQVSVPRSRIQHTDVTQGPFERWLGLGTLVIYTAGTHHAAVPIEGLPHAAALALRDALLSRHAAAAAADQEPAAVPPDLQTRPARVGDDDAI